MPASRPAGVGGVDANDAGGTGGVGIAPATLALPTTGFIGFVF